MSSLEVIVHVDVVSVGMAGFAEAVHVELSNEGAEVAVLEVTGQDLLGKASHLPDVEAVSATRPTDHFRDLQVLLKESSTYTISSSLLMKSGMAEQRPFRLRLRFILSIYYIHPHTTCTPCYAGLSSDSCRNTSICRLSRSCSLRTSWLRTSRISRTPNWDDYHWLS